MNGKITASGAIDARLGRGLVFSDEIAGQQIRIRRTFGRSEAAGNFWEAEAWAGQGRRKGPSGYESWIGFRGEQAWVEKGVRRAGGLWKIKSMEVPVFFLIRLLILHLHLHLHSLYSAALYPTHPIHYTVALYSGSEAKQVCASPRSRSRDLASIPTSACSLHANCLSLLASRQHVWPRPIT